MKSLLSRIMLRILCIPIFVWLFFLLPAGTNSFWQVYVYFGIIIIPMLLATVYFLKKDPEVLQRRLKTGENEGEQKLIMAILGFCVVAMYLIPGFDKRFSWSEIPFSLSLLADVFVLLGYLFMLYVTKVNSFASRVITVEEQQSVIDTGPYSKVRHPMYVGALIMYLATPLALASWWAYLPMSLMPVLIGFRIVNEEQVLSKDLPGYVEYCQRVRWRLIPGIW